MVSDMLPYNFILKHAKIIDGEVCYDMTLSSTLWKLFRETEGTEAMRTEFMDSINEVVELFYEGE